MASDPSLPEMTLRQLRNQAMQLEISKYSRMSKAQLIQSIREARADLFGISKEASPDPQEKEKVASTKFHVGTQDKVKLAVVDAELGELPESYGRSRIVLLPRDPQWAYAYWDISAEDKASLRQQGGLQLTLRLIDVTEVDHPNTGSIQEYPCTEVAREWYLPIPVSDRSYAVEIGYRTGNDDWLQLARSAAIMVPPSHPSDWIQDHFISIAFDQILQGKTVYHLDEPPQGTSIPDRTSVDLLGSETQPLLGWVALSDHLPGSLDPWMASGLGLGRLGLAAHPRSTTEWVLTGKLEADTELSLGDQTVAQAPDGSFELGFDTATSELPVITVKVEGEPKSEIYLRLDTHP